MRTSCLGSYPNAPDQPSAQALAAEPLSRPFSIVFDREGYSPQFFREMKKLHIGVLTYYKFPGQDWSLSEFYPREVTLVHGGKVLLHLAERGVRLSNGLWVRQVRKIEPVKVNGTEVAQIPRIPI